VRQLLDIAIERRAELPCLARCTGDIALAEADALGVSANPQLEGTARSNHWRFAGKRNADGAVRAAGGPSLAAAVDRLRTSLCEELTPGMAVASSAGGSLRARWVVHCVAPDALSRSPEQHAAFVEDPQAHERALSRILEATFSAAIATATSVGAVSLALPALGCGVRGFDVDVAGDAAFRAASTWLRCTSPSSPSDRLQRLDFLIVANGAVWTRWPACARRQLGSPGREGEDVYEWLQET
jgi:O-acetyl-ADP-ribose deacetylase (regulator of RNase III)